MGSYIVTRVGSKCPLIVGERVEIGNRSTFDLLTGEKLSIDVVRENGDVVMLVRGPETGAYLEDAPDGLTLDDLAEIDVMYRNGWGYDDALEEIIARRREAEIQEALDSPSGSRQPE